MVSPNRHTEPDLEPQRRKTENFKTIYNSSRNATEMDEPNPYNYDFVFHLEKKLKPAKHARVDKKLRSFSH